MEISSEEHQDIFLHNQSFAFALRYLLWRQHYVITFGWLRWELFDKDLLRGKSRQTLKTHIYCTEFSWLSTFL